jgi:hypothetical protein
MECVVKTVVRTRKFLEFILTVSPGVDVKRHLLSLLRQAITQLLVVRKSVPLYLSKKFGLRPYTHKTTPMLPFTLLSLLAY